MKKVRFREQGEDPKVNLVMNKDGSNKVEVVQGGITMVKEKRFVWKIENYEFVRRRKEYINAQKFRFDVEPISDLPGSKWEIHLSTDDLKRKSFLPSETSVKQDAKGYISLQYKKTDKSIFKERSFYQLLVEICDKVGGPVKKWNTADDDNKESGSFPAILAWGPEAVLPPLSSDGSLLLHVTYRLYSLKDDLGQSSEFESKLKRFHRNLPVDLSNVFDPKNVKADTVLISNDGKEFEAHKFILKARSPVIHKMMSVSEDLVPRVIRLDDLSSNAVKAILQYFYRGTLPKLSFCLPTEEIGKDDLNFEVDISELVYAASKYDLKELLSFFDENLGCLCSENNAFRLLEIATMHSLKKADEDVRHFIKGNHALLVTYFEIHSKEFAFPESY